MSVNKPVLEDANDDDIDNMDMDIAQFDPSLKTPIAPLRPEPSVTRSQDESSQSNQASNSFLVDEKDIRDPRQFTEEEKRAFNKYQTIYPCYFDKQRSHNQGRRVAEQNGVDNPLAKTIADACRFLQIPVLLELDKSHPQDFGNPGRVKVLLKEDGLPVDSAVSNKRQLFNAIAKYLQQHPTTLKSIGTESGHPIPPEYAEGFEPSVLPKVKGFTMNDIVPVHSPYTMKHPMTKHIYDAQPEQAQVTPSAPKQPKKKIMRVRG